MRVRVEPDCTDQESQDEWHRISGQRVLIVPLGEPLEGPVSGCTLDDACEVPQHWQDKDYPGPHRDPSAVRFMAAEMVASARG